MIERRRSFPRIASAVIASSAGLSAGAPSQVRRISGVVEAGTSADVAFQTAGHDTQGSR